MELRYGSTPMDRVEQASMYAREIADLEKRIAELEAARAREKLWQGRSNVMREEMQKAQAENERLVEILTFARRKLCRYCADENYADRGPDSVGEGSDYWHWGIGTGDKRPCDAAEIRRAALVPETP